MPSAASSDAAPAGAGDQREHRRRAAGRARPATPVPARQQRRRRRAAQRDDDARRRRAGGRATSRATSAARNAEARPASDQLAVRDGQRAGGEQDRGDGEQRGGRQRAGRAPARPAASRRRGAARRPGPRCRPRRWSCRLPRGEGADLVDEPGDLERLGQVGVGAGGQARGRRRPSEAPAESSRMRMPAVAGSARRAAQTSRPVAPGMETSRTARSGSSARARPARRAPSATEPTTVQPALRTARHDEGADVVLVVGDQHADGGTGRRPRWLPVGQGLRGARSRWRRHQGQRPPEQAACSAGAPSSPLRVSHMAMRRRGQHCAPPGEPGGAQCERVGREPRRSGAGPGSAPSPWTAGPGPARPAAADWPSSLTVAAAS